MKKTITLKNGLSEVMPAVMRAFSVLRKDVVLSASLVLAAVSSIFVRPDAKYAEYIDFKTLALLFGLMTVMAGFQKTGLFQKTGERLLAGAGTVQRIAAVLVFLCFFTSMLITNDVALITFVPFAITVCRMAGMEDHLISIVTMQTVAANLGSMVTPVGNPQNLYIYSKSGMGMLEFLRLTGPLALAAFIMLFLYVRHLPDEKPAGSLISVASPEGAPEKMDRKKLLLYIILFIICLASVLRVLDYRIMLAAVILAVLAAESSVLKDVDYSLLLTFTGFFIFTGNIGRIPALQEAFGQLVQTLGIVSGVLVSQVISNVPAALLLSGFTQRWDLLLIGVSLGGLGTLIASMASLISYKFLAREYPEKKTAYLKYFTITNLIFLAVLLILSALLQR